MDTFTLILIGVVLLFAIFVVLGCRQAAFDSEQSSDDNILRASEQGRNDTGAGEDDDSDNDDDEPIDEEEEAFTNPGEHHTQPATATTTATHHPANHSTKDPQTAHPSISSTSSHPSSKPPSHSSATQSQLPADKGDTSYDYTYSPAPAIPSSTAPPYTPLSLTTGHDAFPVHYAHEYDGVADEWDQHDRNNKAWYHRHREHLDTIHHRPRHQMVSQMDPETANGFLLAQDEWGEHDRHHPTNGCTRAQRRLRRRKGSATSRQRDLTRHGHCKTSPTTWSARQHDPPRCPRSAGHKRVPVHLADVQAGVKDSFEVGTLLPAFTYRECS